MYSMQYMQAVTTLAHRILGHLGRLAPADTADQGASLRFLDADYANAIQFGDTLYATTGDMDPDTGDMSLSEPMRVTAFNRITGEFRVDPPLLTLVPNFNRRPPEDMRLVLAETSLTRDRCTDGIREYLRKNLSPFVHENMHRFSRAGDQSELAAYAPRLPGTP